MCIRMAASITLLFVVAAVGVGLNSEAANVAAAARAGALDGMTVTSAPQPKPSSLINGSDPRWEQLDGAELESQLALVPTDSDETAYLCGPQVLLSDFCVASRDQVMGSIKRSVDNLRGRVLRIFFGAFGEASLDPDSVREELSKAGGWAEQHDNAAAAAAANNNNLTHNHNHHATSQADTPGSNQHERAHNSAHSPEAVQERARATPRLALLDIIMLAVNAIKNSLGRAIRRQLATVSSRFGLSQLREAAVGTCKRIDQLKSSLEANFRCTIEELSGLKELKGSSMLSDLEQMRLDDVKCITVRRLLNLAGVCDFGSRVVQHPLFAILSTGTQISKLMAKQL